MQELEVMSDIRGGLPSASNLKRVASCPGSENLIRSVPQQRLKEHEAWASSGTKIHKYLALASFQSTQDEASILFDELNPMERSVAVKCVEQITSVRNQSIGDGQDGWKVFIEKRIWLTIDGEKAFSGQADRVEVTNNKALIIDFKGLYGDVDDAPDNLQLRSLAVLWFNELGGLVDEIWVAIIQPPVTSTPVLCKYTREDLFKADAELHAYLTEAKKPDAPRNAGEWCVWCPAKPHCPTARALVSEQLQVMVPNGNTTVMPPEDLGRFLVVCKSAEKIITAAQERAKELLTNGFEVPGWELKPGNEVRNITNPKEVYKILNAKGLMQLEDLFQSVKLPIGELEKVVRARSGQTAEEVKTNINGLCFDYIEKKKNAPSLKQTK